MKKTLFFILSIVLFAGCMQKDKNQQKDINVYLNGQLVEFTTNKPFIDQDDFVQYPIDSLEKNLNVKVNWDDSSLTATIIKNFKTVVLRIGEDTMSVNEKEIPVTSSVIKKDGVVYVPIISVAEIFGYTANWDVDNLTLTLDASKEINEINNSTLDFGIKLSKYITDKNYMISPLSIKLALAMAANGASGQTKNEILSALKIDDITEYNNYVKNLIERYNNSEDFSLNIANSIWLNTDLFKDKSIKFTDEYQNIIQDCYIGESRQVDNENAIKTINDWIANKTNNKITDVISSPNFLASLINAVYFKAPWELQFDESKSAENTFTDLEEHKLQTIFMNKIAFYNYYEDENLQMVSLPYKNSDISMYVLLPAKNFDTLNNSDISTIFDKMENNYVDVKLPKFKTEFKMDTALKDAVESLGIKSAFSEDAEFSNNMFENAPDSISINQILHQTFINVDEKGTEAAAVTAIMMNSIMQNPEPIKFYANKPFQYFIRDNGTGEILFMGQYATVE